MAKLICPVCKGKDFKKINENDATVCICDGCGSCYRVENKSWFHLGEMKKCN